MSTSSLSRPSAGAQLARWSGRLLLSAAGVALVGMVLWWARPVTVPLAVATLIATQLLPLVAAGARHGVPRAVGIPVSLVATIALALGLTWLFTNSLAGEFAQVGTALSDGADEILNWLQANDSWVREHEQEIREFLRDILPTAKDAAEGLFGLLLGGLSLAGTIVSSAILTFVFLLYLLVDGDGVWRWIQGRFSTEHRPRVTRAGTAAWHAGTGYVRGIALVAFIDTVVIGAGMLVFGTPLAGTLMLLTFVSLFIPILGAWVSGVVIVLVTLGAQGTGAAVGIAVVILVAQQLDSMFVTPLVYRQTVNLHPIVTLSAVIVGSQLIGIIGAFLAVPIVAVGWAVFHALEDEPTGSAPSAAPG